MRKLEAISADRTLIDLRGMRDNLSIELRILQGGDVIDPAVLGTLQRNLGLVDSRIASRMRTNEA